MNRIIISFLCLSFFIMTSCGGGSQAGGVDKMQANIDAAEKALYESGDNFVFDPNKANTLIDAYNDYIVGNPQGQNAAEYLFKTAEIQRSLKEYPKAVQTFQRILNDYPDYAKRPHSLFLMGFTYENDMRNLNEAKKIYNDFMSKYPSHELAQSVKFSLENLGKSPEDIIKMFEKQNQGS